ncbi:uncharacterized protein PAC_02770 [Phialocephala subalpina]|uniref:Protein kinase domain-containing protein n=1 Tax=Phialocephala subalpina TaxID=576137 RepID=A0A1L7WJF8_9HELO|nr:uncharacterized protein PAC_02770 [Phialocephala subalpina]
MDQPGTIFCLVPYQNNKYATEIVGNPANRDRRCVDPNIAPVPFLRIGLDQQLKTPPHLVRFGRRECNDIILNNRFSRNDQCYFDFNKETGELLLHDISEKNDTELYDVNEKGNPGPPQIWKTPRQCVVVLTPDPYRDDDGACDRVWFFKIRDAIFRLIPRRTPGDQGEAAFTEERLAFAGQPDPERTYEGTMQQLINLGLQSLQSEALTTTHKPSSTATYNPHNTRFKTPLEPEEDEVIRYTKLGRLGKGGQGEVHKVVDMYNGNYHACKIVAVKEEVPEWRIHSKKDFRARVEMEVNLVKQVQHHDNIVPYKYTQGFETGENIEIFMPVYDGNLYQLLERLRSKNPGAVGPMTNRMLYQILDALDFVHTHNPQIIHRDIKPANILYQGDKFLLTDFGIAKVVDTSRTMAGSRWYVAPEVRHNGEQTPKVDIYGLGITFVECLVKLPPEAEREVTWQHWEQWHGHLQTLLSQHEPRIAAMLADVADQRPTAHQLLRDFFPHTSLQNAQTNATPSSFGVSSPLTNQVNGTTMIYSAAPTLMEWTRTRATAFFQGNPWPTQRDESTQPSQPNPVAAQSRKGPPNRQPGIRRKGSVKSAKSVDERQKKGHRRGGSSPNTPSQSAGVPKRTSSRRQRSRSKSIRKAQEIRRNPDHISWPNMAWATAPHRPPALSLAFSTADALWIKLQLRSLNHDPNMQSNIDAADQDVPNPHGRASGRLSDTYVIRKTADADNTEEHCYFCFEDWQIGDGMVRLRCCDHWLHEDCLSKSVLDGCCPTCRIWLASLDDALVLAGAASAGDVLKVKELLEKHTPCTAQDYYGRTPLQLAVLDGHEEVAKELLDHRVDTSTTDFKRRTALHLAAHGYSLGVLRLLLERGADIAARDGEGMTPLHLAYQKGVTRMIDCLIEKGANTEAKAIYGLTPEMLHPLSAYSKAMRTSLGC